MAADRLSAIVDRDQLRDALIDRSQTDARAGHPGALPSRTVTPEAPAPGVVASHSFVAMTDVRTAAQNWAQTWQAAWEARDVEQVLTLYAPDITYWTEPFREPYRGLDGAREYVTQSFASEHTVTAWFGEPVVDGTRAAVAWWATQIENDEPMTLAGISLLQFDVDGLVVEEWDAWNSAESMRPRPLAWGGG